MSLTKANQDIIADVIAEAVKQHVAVRLGPIVDLVNSQQARIKSLEARPPMVYKEIWSPATKYVPGDVVTDGGQMWYCKSETQGRRPGGESSATYWRLCVRRGSDGKSCPSCKADAQ
jgi:chitodextrinase